jgi:uncharacterized protein (DUF952 family)
MTDPAALLPLWHLAHAAEWDAAKASGEYRTSTRGRTLEEEGFIHCSYPHQVGGVATAFSGDDPEPLVVLELDRDVLAAHGTRVRVEAVEGGQRFPHLFGPIPVDAVREVRAATMVDGRLVLGDAEPARPPLAEELHEVLAELASDPDPDGQD